MEKEEPAAVTRTTAASGRAWRTRLVRVDHDIIDIMLKEPPNRPFPVFSDEVLERLRMPGLGPMMARAAESVKRSNDLDADILHQYRTKGYAEVEEPVSDEDEEVEVVSEGKRRSSRK